MGQCEMCGNQYNKTFEVIVAGRSHLFDSFECAVNSLAPQCGHCGNRIIGHGVEANERIYCSAHCARQKGEKGLQDHA